MKRLWIVLTLFFILALIIGVTGCINPIPSPTPVEYEFQLREWQMIDDNGRPALQIAFKSAGKVQLTLIDPDGIVVDESMPIPEGVTGAKLYVPGGILEEMPKAGQYRLIVREYKINGEIIATETLSFEGAKATISDVKLTWGYWTQGYVHLKDIRYNIRNDGDIPIYFSKSKLVIGNKESSSYFMDAIGVVLPGDEKTILTRSFILTNIIPGEYAANLELSDGTDKVVCSYSFVVAPAVSDKGETPSPIPSPTSVEREFRLTEWRMIDDNGRPALQIAFTNAGGIYLTLTDPDGIKVNYMYIQRGVTGGKLDLHGDIGEIPKAGQYRLIAREGLMGEIIATETLSFEGAKATISDVKLTWGYWTQGYVHLKDIRYNIRNDGDIPVYIRKCKLVIGDKESSSAYGDARGDVPPGDEKTIRTGTVTITDIIPGEYAANLELRDGTDKIVCSYSFAVVPAVTKETEFKLTQWEVIEFVGKPALRLRFTLYENTADLYLTNPDGVQTDSQIVMVGMNEITLFLAGYRETPDAGQYTLVAKDALRNIVAEEEFYFEGAEATISNVELTWNYRETFEFYSLERISFIVSNNGDLPAYIDEARIAIGDKVVIIPLLKYKKVLPGETKTIEEPLSLSKITSGDKEFTLELKDSTGKIVGSYSRNITPTE